MRTVTLDVWKRDAWLSEMKYRAAGQREDGLFVRNTVGTSSPCCTTCRAQCFLRRGCILNILCNDEIVL